MAMNDSVRVWLWVGLIGATLLMIGLRWDLIERTGTTIPQHDQWQTEPDYLYKPWVTGGVPLSLILHPHNGHRIVPTKVLALALFVGNAGQWDGKLQMTVNALLAAIVLIPLAGLLRPFLTPSGLLLVVLAMACLQGSTILYENALWGFQSHVYFLVVCSLLHFLGILHYRPGSWQWVIGWLAGLLGIFSFGSGWMAAVITAVLMLWQSGFSRLRREWSFWLLAVLAVIGIGVFFTTPSPPLQISLGSDSLLFAAKLLAVPSHELPWFGMVVWAPLVCYLVWRRPSLSQRTPAQLGIMALVAWLGAHVLAIAVGREAPSGAVPNRYMDIMVVGLGANVAILAAMVSEASGSKAAAWLKWGIGLSGIVWVSAVGWAAWETDRVHRKYVEPLLHDIHEEQRSRVQAFLQSNDSSWLRDKAYPAVPSAVPDQFESQLRDPVILHMLPPEIQTSLVLQFPHHPQLNNALPVYVPHQPGVVNRGTYDPVLGSAAKIDARSEPLRVPFPSHLKIMWAGQAKADLTRLVVESVVGDSSAEIDPASEAAQQTHSLLPSPGTTIRLRVFDDSTEHWIAFSRIVWVGPWSYFAKELRAHAGVLQGIGGLLITAALLVLAIQNWRRLQRSAPGTTGASE